MLEITGAERDVARAFNPRSVAIVGASSKAGSLSWWPLHLLQQSGFRGGIYPVNPTRDSIDGTRCYPSVRDLPEVADLAVIAMNAERTFEAVRECADAGIKTVVLPTQGFSEVSAEGAAREREVASLARPGGLRIIGPNTDGIANIATGAIASIQPLLVGGIDAGPVGLATQSGATASSLLVRLQRAGVGCSLYASAGNETDLGLVDYLSVMVQDPRIKLVLSFVEALRRPQEFMRVADLAAELGKPIVLIKVGRSAEGARRAAAHTGALAGADELYDALFASRGVLRVSELSELVAVAKLFLTRGAPKGKGVGIISVSGGQAGAVADKAATTGLAVPAVQPATEVALNRLLEFGKGFNPCDLTGEIARNPSLAVKVYDAFSAEPGLSTIVFARKHLTANASVKAAEQLAESANRAGATPLAIYAMDGDITGAEADAYRAGAIPVFDNLNDLFTAVDRLATYSAFRAAPSPRAAPPRAAAAMRPAPVASDGVVPDAQVKTLLEQYRLRMPAEAFATDRAKAVAAAERIGFPVVLKVASDRIPHKTEAGGVALGLGTADSVAAAFDRVMANARRHLDGDEADGVLVQEEVEGGVEVIVGLKVDASLGPFVVVGLGGVTTELLKDVAIRPAPVTRDDALAMVDGLRGAALLHGFRGTAPCDVDALADTIVDVSRLAADNAGWLAEGDLNPVLVLERGKGVRVVDALLVARDASGAPPGRPKALAPSAMEGGDARSASGLGEVTQ
jgi:acetyltransferase